MKLLKVNNSVKFNFNKILCKNFASCAPTVTGLVLGIYDPTCKDGPQELTEAGERLNDCTNGYIKELLKKIYIPLGKAEIFSGLGIQGFHHIAFAGLGPKEPNRLNLSEQMNEEKENIRIAMGLGSRGVQDRGASKVLVDGITLPEAAAEGSILATYKYNSTQSCPVPNPLVELYEHPDCNSWASGEINAESQNWARYLCHTPPNYKKPEVYANEIMEKLCKFDVRVDIRNREWMVMRKMNAILSMVKSSCEPPLLLEISYCGDDPNEKPIVLIGKGNVFDSGGLFLKEYKGMHNFRADMSGSASIVAAIMAVARKRLPINVRSFLLLYENMPSPMGSKPGDIVIDKRGNHIRLTDPDNDCRVVLADIVNFADYYAPNLIINIGSYTKSAMHTFGTAACATFTTTNGLWNEMQRAGLESGDRFWRMPFWKYFSNLNKNHSPVDFDNYSNKSGGDCCQSAAFLKSFVPLDQTCCCPEKLPYIHVDCFGPGLLSQTNDEVEPYYRKGIKMGRPTRGLIQFLYHRACLLPKRKSSSKGK